jgi:hypothetical protein
MILLGLYIEDFPDQIYSIAIARGSSRVGDTRDAVATVLLEHLIEFDASYLDKFRNDAQSNTNLRKLRKLYDSTFETFAMHRPELPS